MSSLLDENTAPNPFSGLDARTARKQLTAQFRQAGLAFAEDDAFELVMAATKKKRTEIILSDKSLLSTDVAEKLANYASRRLSGEPVDSILGWRDFYGRRFKVSKHVLSPREDTENLVRLGLNAVESITEPICLDLGTGSGAILVTLLAERRDMSGTGVDISEKALKIARENATDLGVSKRAKFLKSAWFENIRGTYDLILSNPPYISDSDMKTLEGEVLKYDPAISLRGGPDGLQAYREIISQSEKFLKPAGSLWLEIGYDQAEAVQILFEQYNFVDIEVHKDLSGHDRCIGGRKPS